jgi:hypothetical protein
MHEASTLTLRTVERAGLSVVELDGVLEAPRQDGPFDLVVVRGPRAVQRLFEMTGSDAVLQMLDVAALDDLGAG